MVPWMSTIPRALALVLVCGLSLSCKQEQPAGVVARAEPIGPPVPCALVTTVDESRTVTLIESHEGRVDAVVAQPDDESANKIAWISKLNYDGEGRLTSIDKTVSGERVSLGLKAVTSYTYDDQGRVLSSSYKDAVGRRHERRWTYEDEDARPDRVEVLLEGEVHQQLRLDYEGAPVWTQPLYLGDGPEFGALQVVPVEGEDAARETRRYDPNTGALVETSYASGGTARYYYGEECEQVG